MSAKHWSKFATLRLQRQLYYMSQMFPRGTKKKIKKSTNRFSVTKVTNRKDKQNKKQNETTQLLIELLGSFNSSFIGS